MVSFYSEELFWKSLKKDDFDCFNDARYADVKMVFDMPLEEFALLESYGRRIHGKIDPKYFVGCIPNYNGANKNLKLPLEEVERAKKISRRNPPSNVVPNNISLMISKALTDRSAHSRKIFEHILKQTSITKSDILEELDSLSKTNVSIQNSSELLSVKNQKSIA